MINKKFLKIKEHIGETWLNREIKFIEGGTWIEDAKGMNKKDIINLAHSIFEKIDNLISKFEKLKGFNKWAEESKTSKHFETCLFELMSMEIFIEKSDFMEIKKENGEKIPEAFIKKGDVGLFLECTKLDSIPGSIENKTSFLFSKSRKKFNNAEGVHIVGTFDFFDKDNQRPTPHLNFLIFHINRRFRRGTGSKIAAFILTNFYWTINPDEEKLFLVKEYWLILNPNKGKRYDEDFFRSLLSVKEFVNL